jgi:hypothetical protein
VSLRLLFVLVNEFDEFLIVSLLMKEEMNEIFLSDSLDNKVEIWIHF